MISALFQAVARRRGKVRRRPKLPSRAEAHYLGAMRLYARTMRRLVLEALPPEVSDDVPIRLDGPTMGPFKGLSAVRLRMAREAEDLPLESIGEQVLRHARDQAVKVVGITNADIVLGSQVNAWRRENVRLITRLTTEKLDEIQELLDTYDGVRVEELTQALTGLLDGNESRAELIARDQTLKLNAELAQTAQTSAGVTHYRWSTSGDGTVRDMHDELEGTEHAWDDPPVTDKYGNRNHPGEDYQCRCVAVPILDEYDSPGIGPTITETGLDGLTRADYSDDQERDESGRWTVGGGAGGSSNQVKTGWGYGGHIRQVVSEVSAAKSDYILSALSSGELEYLQTSPLTKLSILEGKFELDGDKVEGAYSSRERAV